MTRATRAATVLCLCIALVCSFEAQTEDKQKERLTGESKSWKVEVVSAEYGLPGEKIPWEPSHTFAWLEADRAYLFLKLRFEYKGPNADVGGPRVTLVNEKDQKFSNSGNLSVTDEVFDDEMLRWLMSATYPDPKEHKTRSVKTGDRFGKWVEFLIIIPRDAKDLRLIFGGEELSPIRVNPTKLK